MFSGPLPRERADRWRLLDESLLRWFALPPVDSWGVPRALVDAAEHRLGVRLPAALREWYERYGRLDVVWSPQDRLVAPERLTIEQGFLAVCIECQDVVRWGIRSSDLASDDPPVVLHQEDRRAELLEEASSTSAFGLLFAAMNTKWSEKPMYRANGQIPDDAVAAIEKTLPRLPFADTHWPCSPGSQLYGSDDLVVDVQARTWVWLVSLSEAHLRAVDALVAPHGMVWEDFEATEAP
jgi:hypothetical protein